MVSLRRKKSSAKGDRKEPLKEIGLFFADILYNAVIIIVLVVLIRSFLISPFRVIGSSMADTLHNNEFILIARSNVVHMPLFGPSDIVDEKWASLIDFEKIYALSGGFDTGKSSGELRKEMVKRLEQSLFSGASGAVTSFGKKKQSGKSEKTFFLVVNTELIVYGQTVPSAHLTIQGRDQKLNHDGTFSVRFALPEGVQEIPVTAISEDKEDTITITPVVTKETR